LRVIRDTGTLPTQSSNNPSSGFREFAVRSDKIISFFDPPISTSTFHDLVNKGRIIPMKGLRGYYLLNESLRRLDLREVASLPEDESIISLEDMARLAFTLIDPLLFPAPPWMLTVETLELKDVDHARRIADQHRDQVEALGSAEEKHHYFAGVLDAQVMLEADMKSGRK
jgi:hypothetical protein